MKTQYQQPTASLPLAELEKLILREGYEIREVFMQHSRVHYAVCFNDHFPTTLYVVSSDGKVYSQTGSLPENRNDYPYSFPVYWKTDRKEDKTYPVYNARPMLFLKQLG